MSQVKPWLPRKTAIGLIVVGLFMAGGTAASVALVNDRLAVTAQEDAERRAYVEPTVRMTEAMMGGDREAFVAFGANAAVAEHLGRFWDDTKAIGWEVGAVDNNAFGADYLVSDSIEFSLPLGTDAQRVDRDGVAKKLTTGLGYYVTWSDDGQISTLEPLIPMPWDTAEGSHIERRDNVSVYGFADEAALIASSADEIQARANHVFTNASLASAAQLGSVSKSAVFLTADPDRYVTMTDRPSPEGGLGEQEVVSPDFRRNSQGMAITFPQSFGMVENEAFLETSIVGGGSLVVVNASNPVTEVAQVAAHELAHVQFRTAFETPLITYDNTSNNLVVEGYAEYVEHAASGALDRLVGDEVKNYVISTPAETVLTDPMFRTTETANAAYRAAASYLYFVDQFSDTDLNWLINTESGYEGMPFPMWVEREEGITYDDWVAWLQAQ